MVHIEKPMLRLNVRQSKVLDDTLKPSTIPM